MMNVLKGLIMIKIVLNFLLIRIIVINVKKNTIWIIKKFNVWKNLIKFKVVIYTQKINSVLNVTQIIILKIMNVLK